MTAYLNVLVCTLAQDKIWLIRLFMLIAIFIIITRLPRQGYDSTNFLFALICFCSFSIFNFNIISPDFYTIFCVFFVFKISQYLINQKDIYIISIYSIILVFSFLLRFPNIILIPVSFVFMCVKKDLKSSLKIHIIPLISSILYIYHIDFFNLSMETHESEKLLLNYLGDSKEVFLLISLFFLISLLNSNIIRTFIYLISLLILLYNNWGSSYNISYSFIIVSSIISIALINIVKFKEYRIEIIYLIALSFAFPFGSNTGLLKLFYLIIFSPLIFNYLNISYRPLMLNSFLLILPFCLLSKIFFNYEDLGIRHAYYKVNDKKLDFVFTNSSRRDFIENVQTEFSVLEQQGYSVLVGGCKSHIFNYLNDYPMLSSKFYQQDISLDLFKYLTDKSNLKFAYFHIDNYQELGNNSFSKLEQDLLSFGLKLNQHEKFNYFTSGI